MSTRVLVPLVLAAATATAWAHKPFFSDGTAVDAERALVVQDPVVSQVFYHEITTVAPRLWLAFDLKQNQEVYLQIGVPVLERLRDYRPSFALVGPGLPRAHLPFGVPAGMGARVSRTSRVRQPQFFHEPFTGTDSWILREVRTKIAQAGRYYAVAFAPSDKPGKLWLAIGTQEKWEPAEFAKLGEIGRKVRAFHEVGSDPKDAGGNTVAEPTNEKLVFSFDRLEDRSDWTVINDGVMGGLSRGQLTITDQGTALFSGEVSLRNNGGFSSVRSKTAAYDLGGFGGLTIRVRGDGKRYKLTAAVDTGADPVMYQVGFETAKDEWVERHLAFGDFVATYHGRRVDGAGTLDPSRIQSVGFPIADGQEGSFRLEVDWIKAEQRQ